MMLNFRKIKLEDQEAFSKFYEACPQKSADYCFSNLWIWKDKYQTEIAFADNLCWLRQKQDRDYVYMAPIGDWARIYWQNIIPNYFEKEFSFYKIPEKLAFQLDLDFPMLTNIETDRGNWEYIYNKEDLALLLGAKYRNQRKLSNQFKRNYNYTLKPFEKTDIEAVRIFQKQWYEQNRDDDNGFDLRQENLAIECLLEDWHKLGGKLFGMLLLVDDKIMAYTIAEELDEQTIAIHVEKASLEYKGSYQAINQLTLNKLKKYKYVNREQDLGLPGLRKAKMDYNPDNFLRKYNINGYFLITAKERENGIFKNCCHLNISGISTPEYLPLY